MSRLTKLVLFVSLVAVSCGSDYATRGIAPDGAGPATTVIPTSAAPSASTPVAPEADPDTGVVVIPEGGAALSATPGGEPTLVAHEGLVFGFFARDEEWLEIIDTCNGEQWVAADSVEVIPAAVRIPPGPSFDMGRAVIVIDPGHGGIDWGGVGERTGEKDVNLDIAERVRGVFSDSHDVDWETGAITAGTEIPAPAVVLLTRDRSGPEDGDYRLLLGHRAAVANGAGADVLVSIHNNTVPRFSTDIPGTEVFYSVAAADSERLAALIYDELLRSFSAFDAPWKGGPFPGARARVDADGNDYYGLLLRAEMPAVIVEGVYISEPAEEALLRTDEFRQAYAEGVYRGIVRFLTSDDAIPEHVNDPEVFTDDAGVVSSTDCAVPEQP